MSKARWKRSRNILGRESSYEEKKYCSEERKSEGQD